MTNLLSHECEIKISNISCFRIGKYKKMEREREKERVRERERGRGRGRREENKIHGSLE
jgi:hypothetical protein